MSARPILKEHPILFSAPMVRALLNTRPGSWPPEPIDPARPCKGVTRRLSKQWLKVKAGDRLWVRETWASPSNFIVAYNADAQCGAWLDDGNGGRVWHKHGLIIESDFYRGACDAANGRFIDSYGLKKYGGVPCGPYPHRYGWRPSIFMPRWACRIRLECLEDARAERLQEISEYDAELEGMPVSHYYCEEPTAELEGAHRCDPIGKYRELWQSLHNKSGERWADNPELVRVGPFRRIA